MENKAKQLSLIELARSQEGTFKNRPFLDHLIGWMRTQHTPEMAEAARCFLELQNPEALAVLDGPETKDLETVLEDYANELRAEGVDVETMILTPEDFEGMVEDE